ncbi:MAG: hypothetical protein GY720_23205, partial [bacterium]|nr:hypothetical protein [bacterium]
MTSPCSEPLEGFQCRSFEADSGGATKVRAIYSIGPEDRPPVLLMHELPGMSPECVQLARDLSGSHPDYQPGFNMHLPLLFGRPDQESMVNWVRGPWCLRREMSFFAAGKASPITAWMGALVDDIAERNDADAVGVIGMCLSGNLALGLVAHPRVGAAVSAQPSLPFPIWKFSPRRIKADVGLSQRELDAAVASKTPVTALRYSEDWRCPRERFETLATEWGGGARLSPP